MTQVPGILFGPAFTAAVCLACGASLLQWTGIALRREERLPLALVSGAPLVSLTVFLLCAVKLAYASVFLIAGAVVLAATGRRSLAWLAGGDRFPALPQAWRLILWSVGAVFGALYFVNAMAPEISPDGTTYHLGLVDRYFRDHGFERITTHMYANLSQGVEMLYLYAYAFGRHSAAALVHFCFLASLPLAMLSYARRFGFASAGAAAATFVFVSPVVGVDGSTTYNDVATAGVLFTTFYLMRIWGEERQDRLLVPLGLLAGFCFAVKYTAALGAALVAGWVAWTLFRRPGLQWRPLAVFSLGAFTIAGPWLIKNALWVDNPVSPFFNRLFPNPYIHISFEDEYRHHMRNYDDLASHWDIPLEVTVRGRILCGLLGPLFLLAPVGLLALRWKEGRILWLFALVTGLPYAANIGTRFLIPPLPYVALAMALVLTRVPRLAPALVLVHAMLSWPNVIYKYSDFPAWQIIGVRWKAALRIEDENNYLRRTFPYYRLARIIEEVVPEGEKVLTFFPVREAYTTRETLVVYQAAWNRMLGDMLVSPLTGHWQRAEFVFPARTLRKLRVLQTAAGSEEPWSVCEMRLLHQNRELPREPGWRLRAHPNPWDVQRAFDNSPATRWRSWQPSFPGMFLEVDLGGPAQVDRVVLECVDPLHSLRLKVEGMGDGNQWATLSAEPLPVRGKAPAAARRMATSELKRSGVRYFIIHEGDIGRDDFHNRPAEWGITQIAEDNGARVYRID